MTAWEAVEAAVDEIVREFNGRLDVFVANSGIAWEDGSFIDGPLDTMQKVLRVNLDGTLYCARAAALHWRRQKQEGTTVDGQPLENFTYGSFICTASMSGHIVNIPQQQTVYNASKAAVIHACKLFPAYGEFRTRVLTSWLQAGHWPLNGLASRAPTRFLPATSRRTYLPSSRRKPRMFSRTRSRWGASPSDPFSFPSKLADLVSIDVRVNPRS